MEAKEFLKEKFKYLGTVNKIEHEIIDFEFNDLCDLLTEFANQDKWISVNDKLPEHRVMGISVDVIVFDGKDVFQDCYDYEFNNWCKLKYKPIVTHWMPLPEPPKV